MPTRATYVAVPTNKVHPDMNRYMGYIGVPETAEPIQVGTRTEHPDLWTGWPRVTVHRFTRDGVTYFRRPSVLNDHWVSNAVDRYASFGVTAHRESL